MLYRSFLSPLLVAGLVSTALVLSPVGLQAAPFDDFGAPCGYEGGGVSVQPGTTASATAPTLGAAMAAAYMSLFQFGPHSCQSCPPEKPNGCEPSRSFSNVTMTQTEHPDGSWTVTVTGMEGNVSKGKCSQCFGEQPL